VVPSDGDPGAAAARPDLERLGVTRIRLPLLISSLRSQEDTRFQGRETMAGSEGVRADALLHFVAAEGGLRSRLPKPLQNFVACVICGALGVVLGLGAFLYLDAHGIARWLPKDIFQTGRGQLPIHSSQAFRTAASKSRMHDILEGMCELPHAQA